MIPEARLPQAEAVDEPSRTWRVDFESNRIVGYLDGLEAIVQAAHLKLKTPKFKHLIYSWQYGSELDTLIGKDTDYAMSEAKRMVSDALTADTRITDVEDFVVLDGVLSFTVDTIYGSFQMSTEVIV